MDVYLLIAIWLYLQGWGPVFLIGHKGPPPPILPISHPRNLFITAQGNARDKVGPLGRRDSKKLPRFSSGIIF